MIEISIMLRTPLNCLIWKDCTLKGTNLLKEIARCINLRLKRQFYTTNNYGNDRHVKKIASMVINYHNQKELREEPIIEGNFIEDGNHRFVAKHLIKNYY